MDVEDEGIRSVVGGVFVLFMGFDGVVCVIVERERGVNVILGMCVDDSEDLWYRGVVIVLNMVFVEGEVGFMVKEKFKKEGVVDVFKECLKKSWRLEVL